MEKAKVERIVEILEDDHFRQGELSDDDVLRACERHGLDTSEVLQVTRELRQRGLIGEPEEVEPTPQDLEAVELTLAEDFEGGHGISFARASSGQFIARSVRIIPPGRWSSATAK